MTNPQKSSCEMLAESAGAAPAAGGNRAGFTLMEMLVAIGAVAILTVGIASVFSAIGKTVSGGRRISQLTAQSAQIESVMRQDFARMTRDGFLMIRQQNTNTGGPRAAEKKIALNPADSSPRTRRIDEILFFAKGDFTSTREPVHPAYEARGDSARIYYGHGTRQLETGNPKPPALTDFNTVGGKLGQANTPNAFAGDWCLARHQCVLVDPRQTKYDLQPVFGLDPSNPADAIKLADKEGQVALQPAAVSVFRHLAPIPLSQPPSTAAVSPLQDKTLMLRTGTRRLSSGLTDVATITLREVRDIVEASQNFPRFLSSNGTNWYTTVGPNPTGSTFLVDGKSTGPFPVTTRIQAWMDDAWPTQSDQVRAPAFENMLSVYNGVSLQVPTGGRMRVEPRPAHLLEVLRSDGNFNSKDDRTASDYRIDQLQLASNSFLRACSEFIVDWSLGEPDPGTGEMVWYGLSRFDDIDLNGVKAPNERIVTRPFPFRSLDTSVPMPPFAFPYVNDQGKLVAGTTAAWSSQGGGSVGVTDHVTPELIYGTPVANALSPVMCLTSYFGFTDTTGTAGRPWVWPEFVRITVKLVDPQDASTEQTFQYVFKTPGNSGGRM